MLMFKEIEYLLEEVYVFDKKQNEQKKAGEFFADLRFALGCLSALFHNVHIKQRSRFITKVSNKIVGQQTFTP